MAETGAVDVGVPASSTTTIGNITVPGGNDKATRYIVDAAQIINEVQDFLDPILLEGFTHSVTRVLNMRAKLQKRPGPQWIYVVDNRRYADAAKSLKINAQTLSSRAVQGLKTSPTLSRQSSSSSSSTSSTPSSVNNNYYQVTLGNSFHATTTSGTVVLSPNHDTGSGTITGNLVYPTDESSKQVFDEFLATVDKSAPDSGPHGLPSLLNLQPPSSPTAPGHPDSTPGGVRRMGSKASLQSFESVYTDAAEFPEAFDLDDVVGVMILEDEQPSSPQPWLDRTGTYAQGVATS